MYTKRTYKEVRDTFEWEFSGKELFTRWTTIGVNSLGVWLQAYTNQQPYGFFEWKWIKEVIVSPSNEVVYFVMHDMDKIYDNVILYWPKIAFKLAVCKKGDSKAVCYPYRQDTLAALKYALAKGWVNVVAE